MPEDINLYGVTNFALRWSGYDGKYPLRILALVQSYELDTFKIMCDNYWVVTFDSSHAKYPYISSVLFGKMAYCAGLPFTNKSEVTQYSILSLCDKWLITCILLLRLPYRNIYLLDFFQVTNFMHTSFIL